MKTIALFLTVASLSFFFCDKSPSSPQQLLEAYYDYLKANDFEFSNRLWSSTSACDYELVDWHFAPPHREQASRYSSYKRSIEILRADDLKAIMKLTLFSARQDTIELNYYAKNLDGSWMLVNPPEIECVGWDSVVVDGLVIRRNVFQSYSSLLYSSLATIYKNVGTLLGYREKEKIDIFMAPSKVGVATLAYYPEPIASRSFPACRIVISEYRMDSRQRDALHKAARLAGHELVHIMAFDMFGHDGYSVPFLREGLATYFCGVHGVPPQVCKVWAQNKIDSLPGLDELAEPDLFYSRERLYSGAGATFVDFFVKSYGWDMLKKVCRASTTPENFISAISGVDDIGSLNTRWKNHIRSLNINIPKSWQEYIDLDS